MPTITSKSIQAFQKEVLSFYRVHKRSLLWRQTRDPYKIWISEIMLQQTQVPRVVPKYKEFLKRFPAIDRLAKSDFKSVLKVWSGLGYNSRALRMRECARTIVQNHYNKFPHSIQDLVALPGIGVYTAKAIDTFARNKRHVFIETNIRTVFFHHFFKNKKLVSDKEIAILVEKTLPEKNYRQWYAALMDYGSYLKSLGLGYNTKSSHYVKQSKFEGSIRQKRSLILKLFLQKKMSLTTLQMNTGIPETQLSSILESFIKEGLIRGQNGVFSICS